MARSRNAALEAQRNALRKRVQDVNRKIQRLERQGISLSGTEFDPRRPAAPVHKYNAQQLKAYHAQLDKFQSRRTQFVGDIKGRPIPAHEWRTYKAAERRTNLKARRLFDRLKNIEVPRTGLTMGESYTALNPSGYPNTLAAKSPFGQTDRKASQVEGRKALAKLTKQQQKNVGKGADAAYIKEIRKRVKDMVNYDKNLQKRFKALSDKQLLTLWAVPGFAQDLGQKYLTYKSFFGGESNNERSDQETMEVGNIEVHRDLDWAMTLKD